MSKLTENKKKCINAVLIPEGRLYVALNLELVDEQGGSGGPDSGLGCSRSEETEL